MGLKDKLIAKLWQLLLSLVGKYGDFIKKPIAFKAIMAAAGVVVQKLIDWLKDLLKEKISELLANGLDDLLTSIFGKPGSLEDDGFDDRVARYVNEHPGLRAVEGFIDRDFDESNIGDITLACTDPDYYDGVLENLMARFNIPASNMSGEDYLNTVAELNDDEFESSIAIYEATRPGINELIKKINGVLPWLFLVYIIILKVKEFLTQNEWPSKYRAKYLAKQLRMVGSILKKAAADTATELKQSAIENKERALNRIDDIKEQARAEAEAVKAIPGDVIETGRDLIDNTTGLINSLTDSLKSLDNVIGGVMLATLIYEFNRRLLQEEAMAELNASVQSIACIPIDAVGADGKSLNGNAFNSPSYDNSFADPDFDGRIGDSDFLGFSCPIPLDNVIVPNEPFNSKVEEFACPIPFDTFPNDLNGLQDLGLPAPLISLASKAIYTDLGSSTLTPLVSTGDAVVPGTRIWSVKPKTGKSYVIYSEIGGIVKSIDAKVPEMIIDNVYVPDETELEKAIKDLQTLYKRKSDTEILLKDYYIRTLLPTLLTHSPLIDASISSADYSNIIYPLGGIERRNKLAVKEAEKSKETYEKNASEVTGKDNIVGKLGGNTINPENENPMDEVTNPSGLSLIQKELETVQDTYYKEIRTTGTTYTSQAERTLPNKDEFILWEWYLMLYDELIQYANDGVDLQTRINDPEQRRNADNTWLETLISKVSEYLNERYFIDGEKGNAELLKGKVNELGNELDQRESLEYKSTYFDEMNFLYNKEIKDKNVGSSNALDYTKTISFWVSSLGKKNLNLESTDKIELRTRIFYLWELSILLSTKALEEYETVETPFTQTAIEGNFFESYFKEIWKAYDETPKLIEEKLNFIDKIGRSAIPPSSIFRDNEEYLLYAIGDARECALPTPPDPRLSPFSEYEFKDLSYWLKYCGFATLASIASLPPNWGTGFPPPFGPIPFPTVYIPIKAFQLAWGALVIGITITGIFPFPWVMCANLSSEHHIPLVDPATIIRKALDKVKKALTGQLREFRGDLLQRALTNVKKDVDFWEGEVVRISDAQATLRANKPKRDRAAEAGLSQDPSIGFVEKTTDRAQVAQAKADALLKYTESLANWVTSRAALAEEKISAQVQLFAAQTKWDVLYAATQGGKITDIPDPQVIALQKTEEVIEKSFQKIEELVAQIDPLVASIKPLVTVPGSANFFFTLKNPKPIQEMADGLNESINNPLLERIQKPFDLNRSDLMDSGYKAKVRSSFINGKSYMNKLAASSIGLIQSDPFPKYEMLRFTNLAWILKFLLPSWAPTGGGQFGFPGMPRPPKVT